MQQTTERRFRRGNVAVVALGLGMVLGFGALAVDISLQRVTDVQVQAAIEAAALAGAAALDRTVSGFDRAREQAIEVARLNGVAGSWDLSVDDIELGIYDVEARQFEPVDTSVLVTGDDLVLQINAVRIQTTHDGIAAVLGRSLGVDRLSTTNAALAMRPNQGGAAKSVACFLPLAIPECEFLDWMTGVQDENPKPQRYNHNETANIDNIAWALPDGGPVGMKHIEEAFVGTVCHDGLLSTGETIELKLNNGQGNLYDLIASVLNGSGKGKYKIPPMEPDVWDERVADRPARDGESANCPPGLGLNGGSCAPGAKTDSSLVTTDAWDAGAVIQGPIALVRPPEGCVENINFVGKMEVSGFAWAMIYDVADHGNSKNIWIQLDFINERDFGSAVDPDGIGNVTGLDKPVLVF